MAKAPATPDRQVWLCKPGLASNPCLSDMTATVVKADGTTAVEHAQPASDPKIDCFYVYPTVSNQPALNANLKIDPAEIGVAIAQASRYSQVCNVYAPMYRQVTIYGIINPHSANASKIAYADVAKAWNDYLARYNHGRGVVLIGHSQGAFILKQLIASKIETDPAVRDRVVSAILLGGNVTVPDGKDVGGDLQHLPVCHTDHDVHCVIAYSSFDHPPPGNTCSAPTPPRSAAARARSTRTSRRTNWAGSSTSRATRSRRRRGCATRTCSRASARAKMARTFSR